MPSDVKRRPGQHHGDLRNALLTAALDLVAERGPRGFTVAEAARRAGVSSAAPYKHFADRDALLAALAVRGYEEQHRRFTRVLAANQGAAGSALPAAARDYVAFAVESRPLFEVVFGAGLDKAEQPEVAAASARVLELLLPAATQAAPDAPRELLLAVAALAHGHAVFLLERAFGPVEEAMPQVLDRVDAAVRALIAGRRVVAAPARA